MPPVYKRMYRVYIKLGNLKYYANRPLNPNDKIKWMTWANEYPEVYTWKEVRELREKYMDQNVRYEEVVLVDE